MSPFKSESTRTPVRAELFSDDNGINAASYNKLRACLVHYAFIITPTRAETLRYLWSNNKFTLRQIP
jgi:hypothetical protein